MVRSWRSASPVPSGSRSSGGRNSHGLRSQGGGVLMSRTLGLLCIVALVAAAPASSGAKDDSSPERELEQQLLQAAAQSRHAVWYRNGEFSGPGWDLLLEEGRHARFFLVGEEHGVAEIPAVVRELFRGLQPAGYRQLAIEISPPMARVLDELARPPDGLDQLTGFFCEHPPGVAFFTLREEAELLAAVRAMIPDGAPVLWGLDYEVSADRYLLDRVRQRARGRAPRAAAEALYAMSAAAWESLLETRNPAAFFSFATPPEAMDELRRVWPDPDPESALTLDVIEQTLAINQLFVTGRNWESNERRAQLNRAQLLRHWNEALATGEAPRVLFKFGASHMLRGRNMTEVFDVGNLAAEMAAAEGSKAFHLLVVGGPGTEHAVFDPAALTYVPAPVGLANASGLSAIVSVGLPEGFTLVDLRRLRPLLSAARTRSADPELMRYVHGFDALLILGGSTPAEPLPAGRTHCARKAPTSAISRAHAGSVSGMM
jgi:hypothetical protein